jgi:hypothetical protein
MSRKRRRSKGDRASFDIGAREPVLRVTERSVFRSSFVVRPSVRLEDEVVSALGVAKADVSRAVATERSKKPTLRIDHSTLSHAGDV